MSKKYALLLLSLVAVVLMVFAIRASVLMSHSTVESSGSREAIAIDETSSSIETSVVDRSTLNDLQSLEDLGDADSSSEHFNDLVARADAGDVSASYQVGKTIWQCRSIPLSVDDYNLKLGELPDNEQPPQANYNVEIERIRKCEGVPRDHIIAGSYYKVAADSGNLDAMYEYATILPFLHDIQPESPDFGFSDEHVVTLSELDALSIEYLLDGATRGDLRSAVALAAKFQYGFEAFVQGDRKSLRQPDLMRAYAWYYAANIAQGGTGLQAWKTSVQRPLQESGLLAEAEALGREYFENYFQDINGGANQ